MEIEASDPIVISQNAALINFAWAYNIDSDFFTFRERAVQLGVQVHSIHTQPGSVAERIARVFRCGFNVVPSSSNLRRIQLKARLGLFVGSRVPCKLWSSDLFESSLRVWGYRLADFGTLIWSSSAFCFGPPSKRTDTLMRAAARSGGTRWIGDQRWSCSKRSAGSTSSA